MSGGQISLLVVEDDEVDAEACCRALRRHQVDATLQFAREGTEGLKVLRDHIHHGDSNEIVVILDLNMPGMNGHEFLAEIRADADLRDTRVYVLTSSDHDRDIRLAFDQNVAGYFVKSEVDTLFAEILDYATAVNNVS